MDGGNTAEKPPGRGPGKKKGLLIHGAILVIGVAVLPFDVFGHCGKLQKVELPEGIVIHPEAFRDSLEVEIVYRPVLKKKK